MNLAYKKILGKFTKVLGFGKTPPPCWEKFPNNIVFFFWERTLVGQQDRISPADQILLEHAWPGGQRVQLWGWRGGGERRRGWWWQGSCLPLFSYSSRSDWSSSTGFASLLAPFYLGERSVCLPTWNVREIVMEHLKSLEQARLSSLLTLIVLVPFHMYHFGIFIEGDF